MVAARGRGGAARGRGGAARGRGGAVRGRGAAATGQGGAATSGIMVPESTTSLSVVYPSDSNVLEECLKVENTELIRKLPKDEELIKEYHVTPLHLSIGLVPSRLNLKTFRQLRAQYLHAIGHDHLLMFPEIVLLSTFSKPVDFKSYLLSVGFDEDKVESVPDDLTYSQFKEGQVGKKFGTNDSISLLLLKRALYDKWLNLFRLDLRLGSRIESACRSLLNTQEHLLAYIETHMPPITIQVFKESKGSSEPHLLPKEYLYPFRNFDESIKNTLAGDIADRFKDQREHVSLVESQIFSPMIHLTNASGTGKTKAALYLGKLTNVIYVKLGGSNGMQVSTVWKVVMSFFSSIKVSDNVHRLQLSRALHMVIQRIIYMFEQVHLRTPIEECAILDEVVDSFRKLSKSTHPLPLFVKMVLLEGLNVFEGHSNQNEYDQGILKDFIDEVDVNRSWHLIDYNVTLSMKEVMNSNAKFLTNRRNGLIENQPDLPDLIIVWDEAHTLMQSYNSESLINVIQSGIATKVDMYRALRLTFRLFRFYWIHSINLTVSTVAKASKFYPPPQYDPSFRFNGANCRMHDPIVLKHTFDVFRKYAIKKDSHQDWISYLFSRERILDIVCCGRPLWGAHLGKRIQEEFVRNSVQRSIPYGICQFKNASSPDRPYNMFIADIYNEFFFKVALNVQIVNNKFAFEKNTFDQLKAVTLLALSLAMMKFPKDLDFAELVRIGPFALVSINVNEETARALVCPEGFFNGTASLLLLDYTKEVLEWLKSWIETGDSSLLSIGELGELIDRLVILISAQLADRRPVLRLLGAQEPIEPVPKSIGEFLMEPVSLREFLNVYAGQVATEQYLESRPGLNDAFMAFSHFYYMGKDFLYDDPYSVAANALSRGGAVVPKQNSKGLDLLIPLVLASKDISFVYIQTKMGKSFRSFLTDDKVFKSSPRNRLKVIQGRPYCYIIRMYNGDADLQHKIYTPQSPNACLCLKGGLPNGELQVKVPYLQYFIDWVSREQNYDEILESNKSLKRSWTLPGPVEPNELEIVRGSYEHYFSLDGVNAKRSSKSTEGLKDDFELPEPSAPATTEVIPTPVAPSSITEIEEKGDEEDILETEEKGDEEDKGEEPSGTGESTLKRLRLDDNEEGKGKEIVGSSH